MLGNIDNKYLVKYNKVIDAMAHILKKEYANMFKFVHENYNVSDLDKSLKFYEEALGLKETRRHVTDDFIIAFVGDGKSDFELELTWIKAHPEKYNLGECEFHLAFVAEDFEAAHKKHEEMGIICFENPSMGIYFIIDPDGYWLEVLPPQDK